MKITIELGSPINYTPDNGTEIEGSFIEVNEPTGKVAHLAALLKTEVGSATKNALTDFDFDSVDTTKQEEEGTPEEKGDALFAIMTAGGANMDKVFTALKEILRETALMAGEKKFTAPMYDRMTYRDIEKVLKAYLGNFIA